MPRPFRSTARELLTCAKKFHVPAYDIKTSIAVGVLESTTPLVERPIERSRLKAARHRSCRLYEQRLKGVPNGVTACLREVRDFLSLLLARPVAASAFPSPANYPPGVKWPRACLALPFVSLPVFL